MDFPATSVDDIGTAETAPARSAGTDADLVAEIQRCELVSRDALVRQLGLIAEAEDRGLSSWFGAQSMTTWLRELLNLPEGDARSRVVVARKTAQRGQDPGTDPSAELPATARALESGAASIDHGRVIAEGIAKLPSSTGDEERGEAEALLAEHARTVSPRKLRVLAERIRYHLDQDGAAQDEQHQVEHRTLHLGTAWDGMTVLTGRLDRETGAKLRAALDPLAAPRPSEGGTRDPRTAGKRNADALETLVNTALSGEQAHAAGSARPQITVTIDHDDLRARVETAPDGGVLEPLGQPITAENARRLACDAEILPIVLGGESQPLDVGRSRRTAPEHLRSALTTRDGRCAFPSCDQPPGSSEAHHVRHWADGGTTALDNLVMLCGHHHRTIHNHEWNVDLSSGTPVFTPPARYDPQQRPRASNPPSRPCFGRRGCRRAPAPGPAG